MSNPSKPNVLVRLPMVKATVRAMVNLLVINEIKLLKRVNLFY